MYVPPNIFIFIPNPFTPPLATPCSLNMLEALTPALKIALWLSGWQPYSEFSLVYTDFTQYVQTHFTS